MSLLALVFIAVTSLLILHSGGLNFAVLLSILISRASKLCPVAAQLHFDRVSP